MKIPSTSNKAKLQNALKQFAAAAQELANVIDETEYQLSESAPGYLQDVEEFAYELTTFVEDEIDGLNKKLLLVV